jgi:2-haloacid dehalogenase
MDAYSHLAVYPDVPGTLAALGSTKCAILSNGSPRMLEAVVRNAGLAEAVDAVLSVDALRIYKPHPDVYRMATDSLRVAPGDVAFISSNCWDIAGATAFGFRTYWINRSGIAPDELGFSPAKVLSGLDGLLH